MTDTASAVTPIPTTTAVSQAQGRLRGNLSTGRLIVMVLAFNAPIGITAGILPLVTGYGAGVQAPLIFLGLGALMLLFAVGFTYMARVIPRAGAFYSFVTEGLGRPVGLAAAFLAVLAYVTGLVYILIHAGIGSGRFMLSVFGFETPWWIVSIVFAIAVGVLGYLRIDVSSKIVLVLVAIEVVAVVAYDVGVFVTGGAEQRLGMASFDPTQLTLTAAAAGAVFAVVAFGGFESTAIFRDEVRNPVKSVPRAAYISVIILTVFYVVGSWLMVQGFGESAAQGVAAQAPTTAFFDNVSLLFGRIAYDVLLLLVVTSGFACVVVMHNVSSRYLFNLAADGILPRGLSRPHPRFGSPSRTSLLLTGATLLFFVLVVILGGDSSALYVQMSGTAGLCLLALLSLASIAIAVYLWRPAPGRRPGLPRQIAASVASVALLTLLVLSATTIEGSTGSALAGALALALPAACIVGGVVVALVLRRTRPERYARIGLERFGDEPVGEPVTAADRG